MKTCDKCGGSFVNNGFPGHYRSCRGGNCLYCGSTKIYAKGYCKNCYRRAKRKGVPHYYKPYTTEESVRDALSLMSASGFTPHAAAQEVGISSGHFRAILSGEIEKWNYLIDQREIARNKTRREWRKRKMVVDIRQRVKNGELMAEIAEDYGFDHSYIYKIAHGERYGRFDDVEPPIGD